MTASPRLQSTRDYSKFELHSQNRNVRHTEILRRSMKRYGYLPHKPLHCVPNGTKFKIKDGHRRFTLARELGLPVYFVVAEDGDISFHEMDVTTDGWSLEDYLTSYVRDGRGFYVEAKDFYKGTGIPLGCCISMLGGEMAGSSNKMNSFKGGGFRITAEGREHAKRVASVVEAAEEAAAEFSHTTPFVQALSRILFVDELDIDEMRRRIVKYRDYIQKQRTVQEYVANLDQVYNHGAKPSGRLPVAFLADAAARSRRVVRRND